MRYFSAALLLLAASGVQPASAETVLLESGRSLEAASVAFVQHWAEIELVDGGSIHVPRAAIVSVTKPSDTAPEPTVAALSDPSLGERPHMAALNELSHRYSVDPALVAAVVQIESAWDHRAISPAGACGLMQLLPETARLYGVEDPFDPNRNLEAGIRHLRRLLDRFDQDTSLALAAYNAGEGRVEYYKGIPPFRETQDYVQRVTRLFLQWKRPS